MRPKVSFIVLSFNYAHYIGKNIDSILKQTMEDFERVIKRLLLGDVMKSENWQQFQIVLVDLQLLFLRG